MNIHELSRRTNIALSTLKRLDSLGVLKVDQEHETAGAIRLRLSRNQPLTVAELLALLDEPDLVGELGRWEARARVQLDALGDVKPAPKNVTAYIETARAVSETAAARTLCAWIKATLPAHDVGHAWLACRLLIGLPRGLRAQDARALPMALLNVRRLPEFAGWWHSEKTGAKNSTVYHQFRGTGIDL